MVYHSLVEFHIESGSQRAHFTLKSNSRKNDEGRTARYSSRRLSENVDVPSIFPATGFQSLRQRASVRKMLPQILREPLEAMLFFLSFRASNPTAQSGNGNENNGESDERFHDFGPSCEHQMLFLK